MGKGYTAKDNTMPGGQETAEHPSTSEDLNPAGEVWQSDRTWDTGWEDSESHCGGLDVGQDWPVQSGRFVEATIADSAVLQSRARGHSDVGHT